MKLTLCLYIWISLLQSMKTESPQNCDQLHFNQILSRTKRFLTFPPGSSFAVKRSFTKSILHNIPRGLSLNVGIGLYYPLPVSTDAWDLTKLLYRLDLSHTDGLSATPKPKKGQDSKTKLTRRNDTIAMVQPANEYRFYPPYLYPYGPFASFKGNGLRNYEYNPGNIFTDSPGNYTTPKDPEYVPLSWNTYEGRIHRNDIQHSYKDYTRIGKRLPDSLDSLGTIFKVNIKACILRAICEFNDDALPSGKSLIMDAAKIFFDVIASGELQRNAGGQNVDCAKRYLVGCPQSPFEFFSKHFRLKANDEHTIKTMFPSAEIKT